MHRLKEWITRHQLIAFFVITFAITWGLGFSYGAVLKRGQFLLAPLVFLCTCGPALTGIIITAMTNTEPRQGTRKRFWATFLAAWIISAIVLFVHNSVFNGAPLSPTMVGFALVAVLPVAYVIGMSKSRIPAVRIYLATLIRLRGVWGWAALASVLTPALILLSALISSFLGRQSLAAQPIPNTGLALIGAVAVKFVYQLFFFNATGEEAGWRGFALPRLQTRTSPLVAALILALFWVPWHLFLWQAEGRPVWTLQFWVESYIIHLLFSLFIVWMYNRSGGNILVAGITHAAANTAFAFVPRVDFPILCATMAIVALVLIMADRMWAKLSPDHPAVYRSPLPVLPLST